ncbi:putative thioesterase [Congregibacter litoralis KT71]|uniref:Putative thioesterase n=1 Tax=Congregibacter litoralis KT71 TaxID=314285 RepID=A4A7J6_9GAMM|nr:thioesterase family protein [Congregibacter litoralis]EAQ98265.2 putative thioesterase [Congregibacter litoralis KT71]
MHTAYIDSYKEIMRVRFRDTDAQGHMFFANYLVFADEVAGNYMRELGFDWSDTAKLPSYVFTVNASCDYIHECHAGDEVEVEVGYEKLGNTSATLGFSMRRVSDGEALAKGSFIQVFVNRDSRKPMPVPDSVRKILNASADKKT